MPTPFPTPPADSNAIIFCNGDFLEASTLGIAPSDPGFLTGHGIFETLKAINGQPFAPTRHFQRLTAAANIMGLQTPTESALTETMQQVLAANGLQSARLRVTISPGTLIVAAAPIPARKSTARVITLPFCRNEHGALSGLKTTSYGENIVAQKLAREADADEAIFGNTAGNLCEGSMTNVFAVFDGKLTTPPLAAGCLPGVTRALTIQSAQKNNIDCTEIDTSLRDLATAEEIFLSSTLRELQPVKSVDGIEIPTPEDGFFRQLQTHFSEIVKRTMNP